MPKPFHVQHHLPEPPRDGAYWVYPAVWVAGQAPPRETRRERLALVWWSYKTWAVKVYKECRGIRYGKTKDIDVKL